MDGTADDRRRVREALRPAGHDLTCVEDALSAVARLEARPFDLVLTELMLKDMSGPELAQYIRRHPNGQLTRVVVLSTRNEAAAIAHALDSGIDDYLTKPCRDEELLARVGAALRRPPAVPSSPVMTVGPVSLDRVSHKVRVQGREIGLAPAEFRLLAHFMENPGRVLARRQLLEQVWRRRNGIGERTVDVHVRRLRAALEPHGCQDLLQTVRGFGYRFG